MVPPKLGIAIKKYPDDANRGIPKASLTRFGYDRIFLFIPFTLITVASPAQANRVSAFALQLQGPFSFIVQAGLSLSPALCAVLTKLTRPHQSFFLLSLHDYSNNPGKVKGNSEFTPGRGK